MKPTTPPAPPSDTTADARHAARSGAVQTLTVAVQGILTVTHVLLARLFGTVVFGNYQACLAMIEILTRAGAAGAPQGVMRYVSAHRAQGEPALVRSALGTGLRLAVGVAGTLAVALIAASEPVARLTNQSPLALALRVMAPAAVFAGCTSVLVNATLAAKVTRANFIVRGVGEPLLLMAAGLLAALVGRSLIELAVAHVIAAAATLTLALFVVGRVFGPGELSRAARAPWLPGFARFSTPIGAGELLNAVLQRADIVLLATFAGPSAAAVYAAAEFISRVISNARSVFDAVAAPIFSESIQLGQSDRLRYNLQLMTRWVATAAVPVAVTVVALRRDLLSLYGPAFAGGATTMALLAGSHLVNVTIGLSGYVLSMGGWPRLVLANNVIATAVNLGLAFLLIPRFGTIGAAVAALSSVTVSGLLVLVEVRLAYRVYPFGWATLKPFIAGAATLVVELAVSRFVDTTGVRVPLAIVAGLVSYLAMLFALRLAPEEQRLARSLWNRLRRQGARGSS